MVFTVAVIIFLLPCFGTDLNLDLPLLMPVMLTEQGAGAGGCTRSVPASPAPTQRSGALLRPDGASPETARTPAKSGRSHGTARGTEGESLI